MLPAGMAGGKSSSTASRAGGRDMDFARAAFGGCSSVLRGFGSVLGAAALGLAAAPLDLGNAALGAATALGRGSASREGACGRGGGSNSVAAVLQLPGGALRLGLPVC